MSTQLAVRNINIHASASLATKLRYAALTMPVAIFIGAFSNCLSIGTALAAAPAIPAAPVLCIDSACGSSSPVLASPDWNRTEAFSPWNYVAHYPSRSGCAANEAHTYEVGPGKAYANPVNVPWLSLLPCDQVLIYYRDTPYTDIIFVGSRGYADKYITIKGVRDSNGRRPVFDGNNAVMPKNTGANSYLDSLGMLIVSRPGAAVTAAYGYKPGYLHITGLKFQNVRGPAQVTDMTGAKHAWADFSAGVYVNGADRIAITDCEFADNSLGTFVNSQNDEAAQSRELLVSSNYYHGNGVVNQASEHNSYTEAIGTVYEYNYFGPIASGAGGDNIKERSAGVVFRYNYIQDGVNLISLRDPQSNATYEAAAKDNQGEVLAASAFIYSNILVAKNPTVYGDAPVIIAHGDGIYGDQRQVRYGALYFYNNRVVSALDASIGHGSVPLFDLINTRASTTVVARNNLFYATSHTNGASAAPFALFYWQGIADWQSNSINVFRNVYSSSTDGGLAVGTMFNGSGLGGLTALSSMVPGFVDATSGNYLTTSSSPFALLTTSLPSAVTSRGLTPQADPVVVPNN